MGERSHAAPWRKAVVDIRFGLLKKLARDFFADLGVPISEGDLLKTVLEFYSITLTMRPVPEVRVVISRHPKLGELINALVREGAIHYTFITKAGNSTKTRK